MAEPEHKDWTGKTGGTPRMQRMLIRWFHHTSLFIPYWCMGWMVPFYMLTRRQGYLASYRFYRRRFHMNPIKAFAYVYLNHFRFGQIIIDRFAAYAVRRIGKQGRGISATLYSRRELRVGRIFAETCS